jgi:hypothetical protein
MAGRYGKVRLTAGENSVIYVEQAACGESGTV